MSSNRHRINPPLRQAALQQVRSHDVWDVVVIGGGATGMGVALDAALRGYKTLLLEARDFAEGTSSKSSKLLHGGVRYLAQGNISLVREALHERATILKNAPHVAWPLPFVIPCKNLLDTAFYGVGLKMYDALAGRQVVGGVNLASSVLGRQQFAHNAAPLKPHGASIEYFDGQFDDARLVMSIAKTARQAGASLISQCAVQRVSDSDGGDKRVAWIEAEDQISGEALRIATRCVVHATGTWPLLSDTQRQAAAGMTIARGSHVVVRDLGLKSGVLLPKTPDGRVLFILPWLGHTLIGTTDVAEPVADFATTAPQADIDWILQTANTVLQSPLSQTDVTATFVGYRPLVRPAGGDVSSAKISREHHIEQIAPHTVRVLGGKWTTYRKMAQDTLDFAIAKGVLPSGKACATTQTALAANALLDKAWQHFQSINPLPMADAQLADLVRSAIEEEDATSVEDFLYRRTRLGFVDQRQALALADKVAPLWASFGAQSKG